MERMQDKFQGALLGTMLGDALGAPWEGADAACIASICAAYPTLPSADQQMNRAVFGLLLTDDVFNAHYTDDTQMALALAETLIEQSDAAHSEGDTRFEAALAVWFADVFDPMRGYGPGAHRVLMELRRGAAWNEPAARLFGGTGSFGNGAAMRVAPVGLLFLDASAEMVRSVARRSALPTHTHPLGIGGAVMQAGAVRCACRCYRDNFDSAAFLADVEATLGESDANAPYCSACESIRHLLPIRPDPETVGDMLGNDIAALESVPAALYAFIAHPHDFRAAVTFAVQIGNDTDTIAAMCGAISGAFLDASALPAAWLAAVENGWQGRDYARSLADRLFAAWRDRYTMATSLPVRADS